MSDDQNPNPNNIMPYETLKTSLDTAIADMNAKSAILLEAIRRQDPPLYIAIALHNFNAAYATVTARINAFVSEYAHMAEVTNKIENQRDEITQKYESLKKTVNQLKKLNLDDGDPNDKKAGDDSNNQKPKRKRGKK